MGTIIYLDECGFTGDDLLHAEQPIFTIATHSLDDAECERLKGAFFGSAGFQELKHKDLQRKKVHQQPMLAMLRELLEKNSANIKIGLAHKKYALTLKVVDLGVEPVAHRTGFDIYRTDFMRTFGNLMYFVLQSGETNSLDRILKTFQLLIRQRTPESLREFQKAVETDVGISVHDELLELLRGPIRLLELADILTLPRAPLDLSLTTAFQCVIAWRKLGHQAMRLRHDRSSNMARHQQLWDAFVSPDAPPALVGYGSESVEFPLGVESTEFVSAASSAGVQVADVLAGAFARWGRWASQDKPDSDAYAVGLNAIISEFGSQSMAWVMWPQPDVTPRQTSPDVGDAMDYLTQRAAASMKRDE